MSDGAAVVQYIPGAPRRAFQPGSVVAGIARPLSAVHNNFCLRHFSLCRRPQQLSVSAWVLSPPKFPKERRETRRRDGLTRGLNVPLNGRCGKEGRDQPSTRPGIEPRTSWLAIRDLINCSNLTHTNVQP